MPKVLNGSGISAEMFKLRNIGMAPSTLQRLVKAAKAPKTTRARGGKLFGEKMLKKIVADVSKTHQAAVKRAAKKAAESKKGGGLIGQAVRKTVRKRVRKRLASGGAPNHSGARRAVGAQIGKFLAKRNAIIRRL